MYCAQWHSQRLCLQRTKAAWGGGVSDLFHWWKNKIYVIFKYLRKGGFSSHNPVRNGFLHSSYSQTCWNERVYPLLNIYSCCLVAKNTFTIRKIKTKYMIHFFFKIIDSMKCGSCIKNVVYHNFLPSVFLWQFSRILWTMWTKHLICLYFVLPKVHLLHFVV